MLIRWIIGTTVLHFMAGRHTTSLSSRAIARHGYYSIRSERLDAHWCAPPCRARDAGRRKVLGASAKAVVFADGDRVEANGVIGTQRG
jgi:lycopene beta-cyclase